MPLLIYSCQACGAEMEFLLDHGQEPDSACACGAAAWRRGMPKRVGIHFKGGGFYRNDSRGANGTTEAKKPGKKAKETPDAGKGAT